ncbi:ABC transporter ATP-binding protein [Carboxydochorda subterranea]|uniref:ABC transporter ATP-binding protein n=1 Tax=Carboxydichorda subterranea TaxID=3109565 RepID=A0ABZ1BY99_9FIRM|nr:ABC transporter ATP-binding protein [Limnochorda sp. L945t]WRP17568.1 ABC transporter ATP-binding protein [Limnochorda sp. L945t]
MSEGMGQEPSLPFLQLRDVAVAYRPGEWALQGISFEAERGELVSLLGPSGCGKTTTLRVMAGFIPVQRGYVTIGGRDYTNVPPNRRNIGLVFQSYALFPHLTVFENVAFGLRLRHLGAAEIGRRVGEALRMVGLEGLDQRLPGQLSGGQQQRVALARAIVIRPQLLLLDEPLSNLDARLRVEMRGELRRVQRRLGVTMVYVTHDQSEAMALSDRVIVMRDGRIEQIGTPEEVYRRPGTLFVAQFMGFSNRFRAQVIGLEESQGVPGERLATVAFPGGRMRVRASSRLHPGRHVTVAFRPDAARLTTPGGEPGLRGPILLRIFQGGTVHYTVRTPAGELAAEVPAEQATWGEGDAVEVAVEPDAALAFEEA